MPDEYKPQGFLDGLGAGFDDYIRIRDIPEVIKAIPGQLEDIIHGPDSREYSRASVIGNLIGHAVNPTFLMGYGSLTVAGIILYDIIN